MRYKGVPIAIYSIVIETCHAYQTRYLELYLYKIISEHRVLPAQYSVLSARTLGTFTPTPRILLSTVQSLTYCLVRMMQSCRSDLMGIKAFRGNSIVLVRVEPSSSGIAKEVDGGRGEDPVLMSSALSRNYHCNGLPQHQRQRQHQQQ
jgi:hypothetical protein